MSSTLHLKVLWLKNYLGLAIDHTSLTNQVPITSYYFWPKTEAWEQLKLDLDYKLWIRDAEKIQILNTASSLIEFWRKNRTCKISKKVIEQQFVDVGFVNLSI